MRMLSGIAHQGSACVCVCVCVCVNPGRQEIIVFTVPSKCLYILLVSHRKKKKTYHNIFLTSSTKLNLLSFNVLSRKINYYCH